MKKFKSNMTTQNSPCDDDDDDDDDDDYDYDDEYDNFYGAITLHMPLQGRLDKKPHRMSEL